MKNIEAMTREARIETLKTIKNNRKALLDCFKITRDETPADTVKALVDRIGYTSAVATVAELINSVGEWDGRIYEYVREWAHGVETAATREEMEAHYIYQPSEIHPAHINQIGQAMREYTPEEPAEEEEQEEETMNKNIIEIIKKEVEAARSRSAWSKGVTAYALELVESLEEAIDGGYFDPSDLEAPKLVERALLNGASDWSQYSWGGSSLIYDSDIAERLCCPSELKKTRNGERRPNAREEWLDVQARALFQACSRVKKSIRAALAE